MQIPSLGATVTSDGVIFCAWAPEANELSVELHHAESATTETIALGEKREGYHWTRVPSARAGDAYGFRREKGPVFPDPASRAQREGVHGLSLVVDSTAYQWRDTAWKRPSFRDITIYELHVGAFTPEGTFLAAAERLPSLREAGVTAIEIMPIADFPGERNWGYDGVLIYAPAHCYGTPDDLRALVDRAHELGIAVILDVVYNHFGPDGNYLAAYSPHYFHPKHHTPWGNGFNFDGDMAEPVRRFFRENPVYWMEQFHIDGFRFDATHEIQDDSAIHILAEMTRLIHERGGYAIAEDSRNLAEVISTLGFDGLWADDFHHTARVGQTAEQHSYYQDFTGSIDELVSILKEGWLFSGQLSRVSNSPRGSKGGHLPPSAFVHCLSNHDQTGNRAFGERLHQLISPEAYRALSVLLCLSPYTPMFFMGQEWAASTPFLFFADHNEELGRAITRGRRKEFAGFPEFADASKRECIPDPQAEGTFLASKLRWEEIENPPHQAIWTLYRDCLHLRNHEPAFRPKERSTWSSELLAGGVATIALHGAEADYLILFQLTDQSPPITMEPEWELVLSSEDERYGGKGRGAPGPQTLVLRKATR